MRVTTTNWGQALVLSLFEAPGGLKPAVDLIREQLGTGVGVRNSFAKLQRVESSSDLNDRDAWRAWLLLTTIGEDPADWGIYNDVVPPAHDAVALGIKLRSAFKAQSSDYVAPVLPLRPRNRPAKRTGSTGPKSRTA